MKTQSAEELRAYAAEIVSKLNPGRAATVVALSGDLGAGKTCFVQGVAAALGVREQVASPTFVIEKIYPLPLLAQAESAPSEGDIKRADEASLSRAKSGKGWQRLIHIDAYRLKSAEELSVLHWSDLIADPANLVLIEWPEQVPGAVPAEAIRIRFDIDGDGRIITIDGGEKEGS